MNNAGNARRWLNTNRHLDSINDMIKMDTLKNVQLQMSRQADTPSQVREGIRAIAYSLKGKKVKKTERVITEAVEKAMEECREVLENLVEALMKSLTGIVEQAKETMARIKKGQSTEAGSGVGGMARAGIGGRGTQHREVGGQTLYADAVRWAKREDISQRARNKTKQIIIDNMPGGEGWKGLTEQELIRKAKIMKDMMRIQGLDAPKMEFAMAWVLKNGGVLYELGTAEAAEWLAKEGVKKVFLALEQPSKTRYITSSWSSYQ
ncbi:hypothetical protein C0989_003954 [Termitomyces sp. Mn162]|nr:hypothetical protein C0989_003954 [Termitomyces sp. Mn162]